MDPVGRHTHVVEPFLADLLTRAVLHLLADIVAWVVGSSASIQTLIWSAGWSRNCCWRLIVQPGEPVRVLTPRCLRSRCGRRTASAR